MVVTCDGEWDFCNHCCYGPGCGSGSGSAREQRRGHGIPMQLAPERCKRQSMGPLEELQLHRIATKNKSASAWVRGMEHRPW